MKKMIAFGLFLVLLCTLALPVSAAAYMSVSASSSTLHRGDSFTLTVSLSNDQPVSNGGIVLSYDSSVFEMVDGSRHVGDFGGVTVGNQGGVFVFETDTVVSGTIFTFDMKVKSGAAFGTYSISGSPSLNIAYSLGGTSVTVACSHSYGAASRVDDSNHQSSCSVCGDIKTEAHNWNGGETITAPTCQQTGSARYTCYDCGATVTGELELAAHSYQVTAQDEDSHRLSCTVCGYEASEAHWCGDAVGNDENGHFQTCAACGIQMNQTPHTPGPEATETADQVCLDCGWVLQPMGAHVHYFTATWQSDLTGHWRQCSGCDEKQAFAAHSYDNDCDTDCNVCHLTRQTEHQPGDQLQSDETQHWYECRVCGEKLEIAAHTPGPEATITAAQLCTACGYELSPAVPHDHVFDGAGTLHFHECVCGERYEANLQSCTVCGAENRQFPWHLVCIGLVIAVLVLLIAVTVLAVKLSRQKKADRSVPREKKKKSGKQQDIPPEAQPKEEWVFE